MHFGNLVIIKPLDDDGNQVDIESAISEAMGPDEEHGGFWDWYQIGGRWTGVLDGYDPHKDPANVEECWLCNGTGVRTDGLSGNGCNGCGGEGTKVKWPTEWKVHQGDAIPVENLTEEHLDKFYRIVTPSGKYYEKEEYVPWGGDWGKWVNKEMPPLDWIQKTFGGCLAVVVDNHS